METLGLLEAALWEIELDSVSPTLQFSLGPSPLFDLQQWRRSPRLFTGLLGLLLAIFSPVFSVPFETLTPAAIAQTNNCIFLKRGNQGSAVSQLQTNLFNSGYAVGSIDGMFGTNTEVALKSFQRSRGLSPDGVYGPATCNALTGSTSAFQSQSSLGVAATIAQFQQPTTISNNIANRNLLQYGDQGDAVGNLQEKLQLVGAGIGVTRNFDNATRNTVREFQSMRGLTVDGIVGPQTNASLENAVMAGNIFNFQSSTFATTNVTESLGKYVVAIPNRSDTSLADIRQFAPNAEVRNLRRGAFVQAGRYENRELAEGISYLLRSQGFDARVITQ